MGLGGQSLPSTFVIRDDNPQIIDANLQDARGPSALSGWLLNRAARAKSRHAATVILGPSAVGPGALSQRFPETWTEASP